MSWLVRLVNEHVGGWIHQRRGDQNKSDLKNLDKTSSRHDGGGNELGGDGDQCGGATTLKLKIRVELYKTTDKTSSYDGKVVQEVEKTGHKGTRNGTIRRRREEENKEKCGGGGKNEFFPPPKFFGFRFSSLTARERDENLKRTILHQGNLNLKL
jgi:hypothetical protein